MATYIAALGASDNNANQKAAQSRTSNANLMVASIVPAVSTTDNNANQSAAEEMSNRRPVIALMTNMDAAPKPIAINIGGGQAGYAG